MAIANPLNLFSGDAARDAAAAREAAARAGYAGEAGLYGQGRGAIEQYYGQAAAPWQSLLTDASAGAGSYADATGVNGPEGLARARARFQADPGYQFALNQSLDALNRAGVARGTAVGNTSVDALNYASGAAAKQFSDYVSRLSPYLGQRTAAASGLSGVYTGEGGALNQNYAAQAKAYADMYDTIGKSQSDAAMADYNAAGNIWGVGLNIANAAAKAYSGGMFPGLPGSMGGGQAMNFATGQPFTGYDPSGINLFGGR